MASLNIPYSFTNGTIANATEVDAVNIAIKAFVETETVQRDGSVKVTAAGIENNAVITSKILDANVTNAKLNNGVSGDIPLVTVSGSAPANNTIGKNGDIWIVV
jgi:hypothetical protein